MPVLESLNIQLQCLNHSLTCNLHSSTGPRAASHLSQLCVSGHRWHIWRPWVRLYETRVSKVEIYKSLRQNNYDTISKTAQWFKLRRKKVLEDEI